MTLFRLAILFMTSLVCRDVTAMPYYSSDDVLDWPCRVHDVTNGVDIPLAHVTEYEPACETCGARYIQIGSSPVVFNVSFCYEVQDVQCLDEIVSALLEYISRFVECHLSH